MSCIRTPTVVADLVGGDAAAADAARRHLSDCPHCRREVAGLEALWDELGELGDEEPDPGAVERFDRLLEIAAGAALPPPPEPIGPPVARGPVRPRWAAVVAATLGAGLLGLLAGRSLAPRPDPGVEELRAELRETHGLVAEVLFEHREAGERLEAVLVAARAEPGSPAIEALVEAARHDPSVNVRLAAIEALAPRIEEPGIARPLSRALQAETAPLAQVELIRALAGSSLPEAREALRRARARDLQPEVRLLLDEVLASRT